VQNVFASIRPSATTGGPRERDVADVLDARRREPRRSLRLGHPLLLVNLLLGLVVGERLD
jgi:hypothetical protein